MAPTAQYGSEEQDLVYQESLSEEGYSDDRVMMMRLCSDTIEKIHEVRKYKLEGEPQNLIWTTTLSLVWHLVEARNLFLDLVQKSSSPPS